MLLRLFQASRRFNVEIQPQLVLLQKTLLNIEGLGRELDPDLDLWVTAKPFLERWMDEQIGWRGLRARFEREAPHWAQMLPQLPRLLHAALHAPGPRGATCRPIGSSSSCAEQRGTQRWMKWLALAVAALAALQALALFLPVP